MQYQKIWKLKTLKQWAFSWWCKPLNYPRYGLNNTRSDEWALSFTFHLTTCATVLDEDAPLQYVQHPSWWKQCRNSVWSDDWGEISKKLSPRCSAKTLMAQRWEGRWTSMSPLSWRPAGLHLFPVLYSSTEFSPLPRNRRLIKRDWLL